MKQLKPPLTSCTRLAVALCYWSRTELVTAGVGASGMPAWILGFAGGLQAHHIPAGAPLAQQTPSSWQTYVLAAHRCGGCRHIRPPVKALAGWTARPGDGDTSAARLLALLLMDRLPRQDRHG